MPQSLVLSLETQSAISSKHLQGHPLQQLFFSILDTIDPQLGHVLRRDKKNYAYTLSAIQPGSFPQGQAGLYALTKDHTPTQHQTQSLQYSHSHTLKAKTKCWWRITFLDDALFEHLVFLWNQLSNEIFPLGLSSIKIERVSFKSADADWACSCSYRDLYEQASAKERNIHLQFITPTAFDTIHGITPLPTAEAVFQSLRKHWNRYSGLVFAPNLTHAIIPTRFDIQTQPVKTVRRNALQTLIGCTGEISFRIGGNGDPLTIKRINALARFTQYCSIGINTRLGMGVVKRIPNKQNTAPHQARYTDECNYAQSRKDKKIVWRSHS